MPNRYATREEIIERLYELLDTELPLAQSGMQPQLRTATAAAITAEASVLGLILSTLETDSLRDQLIREAVIAKNLHAAMATP